MYFMIAALVGGTERREQNVDLVAFDELARLFHCLGRAIGVVIGDVFDHAAVDAALLVDHLEIAAGRAADRRIDRSRSRIGVDIADDDLGLALRLTLGDGGLAEQQRG
ncbi:hypothetical protein ABIF07_009091 [Bradyrhizobium elkanii]